VRQLRPHRRPAADLESAPGQLGGFNEPDLPAGCLRHHAPGDPLVGFSLLGAPQRCAAALARCLVVPEVAEQQAGVDEELGVDAQQFAGLAHNTCVRSGQATR
jgi:hypothetical protein